jgi:hypothetical protein
MRALAFLLLVLPGCAQILGFEEPGLGEGPVAGDGGSDPRGDGPTATPMDATPPPFGDGGLPGQLCADPPSFEAIVKYPVVQRPNVLAVGDLNHDTRKDVVIGGDMVAQLTIYLGAATGQGALVAGSPVMVSTPAGCPPGVSAVATGDFDGDSFSDLIYAQLDCGAAKLVVRRQNPLMPGQFLGEQVIEPVQPGGLGLSVADVNQDGKDDVVVLSMSSVQLLLGRADMPGQLSTAFTDPISIPVFKRGVGAVLADLNGDSKLDIAWPAQGMQYKLQSNSTPGSFGGVLTLGAGEVAGVAVGDLNEDALNDVVSVIPPNGQIYLQNGTSHAMIPGAQVEIPAAHEGLRLVDVNSDGRLDLLAGGQALLQCRAPAPPGSFGTNHPMTVQVMNVLPAFYFDLDGNNKLDALGLDSGTSLMSVAIQN